MPKSRVSSPRRKTSRAPRVKEPPKQLHRFLGISLSGGKSDKACVAVLEYYPEHKKIFLARLYEKIKNDDFISADSKIHEIILQYQRNIEFVAFDVPLSLPRGLLCALNFPEDETCGQEEMEWFRRFYAKVNRNKKPKKIVTPYTQRCVEAYMMYGLEESFEIQHALGSNMAPLTARGIYIKKNLQLPIIEINPKVSVWRIGSSLKVAKSHLRFHKHAVGGDESRKVFLSHMADHLGVFIYQQDLKSMIENNHAFEALIAAYTAFLKFKGKTEDRPPGFPKEESWVEIPKP